jgi:predicted SAM-dependent methyltransferase
MRVYTISNHKLKEMYLHHDDALRPCPWPEEALLLGTFFLTAVDLDSTPVEELSHGYMTPEVARATLDKLIADGMLVRVDDAHGAAEIPVEVRRTSEAIGLLGGIASATTAIAEDVTAFGAHAVGDGPATDTGLLARLRALNAELAALRAELRGKRSHFLASQLAGLGVTAASRGLKLHFGVPGLRRLAGWINIEPAPAELAMSMTWDLPFADGSVAYVFCAHTLEHLYYKTQALPFLRELHRCLEPGGVARIVVPDIGLLMRSYADPASRLLATRRLMKHYYFTAMYQTPIEDVMMYGGTQSRPGMFFLHKYGYDFQTLGSLLEEAGFSTVRRCRFQGSAHAPLRIDDQCSAAQHALGDDNFSVFAEATR